MARDFSSLAVVIAFFAIESVVEFKPVAESEIEILETVNHLGRSVSATKRAVSVPCALGAGAKHLGSQLLYYFERIAVPQETSAIF